MALHTLMLDWSLTYSQLVDCQHLNVGLPNATHVRLGWVCWHAQPAFRMCILTPNAGVCQRTDWAEREKIIIFSAENSLVTPDKLINLGFQPIMHLLPGKGWKRENGGGVKTPVWAGTVTDCVETCQHTAKLMNDDNFTHSPSPTIFF